MMVEVVAMMVVVVVDVDVVVGLKCCGFFFAVAFESHTLAYDT